MRKRQKDLIGPAGEHYVLFRLYQQGILAALVPPGTAKVDVLVLSPDERIVATLQVKTRTRGTGWIMGAPLPAEGDAFYVCVDLTTPAAPVAYVIPSKVVADVLRKDHTAWLARPGRKGQPHRDNAVRKLRAAYNPPLPGYGPGWLDPYRENWQQVRAAVDQDRPPEADTLVSDEFRASEAVPPASPE